MNSNTIILLKEDKEMLKMFFSANYIFIEDCDLGIYENIKKLGDLYEEFIDNNELRGNDRIVQFLLEIRNFQFAIISCKQNNDKRNSVIRVKVLNYSNESIKSRIKEWYYECYGIEQLDKSKILTSSYVKQLNKGISHRILQRSIASQPNLDIITKKCRNK